MRSTAVSVQDAGEEPSPSNDAIPDSDDRISRLLTRLRRHTRMFPSRFQDFKVVANLFLNCGDQWDERGILHRVVETRLMLCILFTTFGWRLCVRVRLSSGMQLSVVCLLWVLFYAFCCAASFPVIIPEFLI